MAKLSKFANETLSNFFLARIFALEEGDIIAGTLSKQLQIKELETEIRNFIETNEDSVFAVTTERVNDSDAYLVVKTAKEIGLKTKYYQLVINPSWSSFEVYQLSESKTHEVLIKAFHL